MNSEEVRHIAFKGFGETIKHPDRCVGLAGFDFLQMFEADVELLDLFLGHSGFDTAFPNAATDFNDEFVLDGPITSHRGRIYVICSLLRTSYMRLFLFSGLSH